MDSITQALLGASVQGAMLGRWQGRKALAYGAVGVGMGTRFLLTAPCPTSTWSSTTAMQSPT